MVEIYKDLLQKMKIKQSMLDEENGDRTIPTPSGLQPPSPPTPTGMKRKIRIPLCRSVPPEGNPFFFRHFSVLSSATAFSSSVGYASCNIPVPARITSIALRRIEPGNRLLLLAIRARTSNKVAAYPKEDENSKSQ